MYTRPTQVSARTIAHAQLLSRLRVTSLGHGKTTNYLEYHISSGLNASE